jgi:leader peptidase (prepilin peptidase)/N-methyltransferase
MTMWTNYMLAFLLLNLFVVGTIVGSLLNVCIHRLPLEKSIMWPGSRCSHCLQAIRWYDNIPLFSYVILRGRCRSCGQRFSARYFLVELLTGISFAGLFYLEVVADVHGLDPRGIQAGRMERLVLPTWQAWTVFGYHALLVCFLIVASFCDFDFREIPFSITIPGTVIGLIGAILFPWPWPYPYTHDGSFNPSLAVQEIPQDREWWDLPPNQGPKSGLYPWPFWGPLPAGFEPGGNWQTGLVTGFLGALVGTLLLRGIRFLFGLGLGVEALGLGDADLMMMAGSFLGWQPIVVAFFVGVFAGLIFGVTQLLLRGDNMMPFGPSLAVGVVVTFLCWQWIGPKVQMPFFNGFVVLSLAILGGILMFAASYFLRLTRMVRQK